jgi:predicted site-specific integrase-resolvase
MSETEYVNIMEAARRCGVCDKTIRRAIHTGKLPARLVQPNRCEIAVSDLERFMPGQAPGPAQTPAIESRIEELERRIQVLECVRRGSLTEKPESDARACVDSRRF